MNSHDLIKKGETLKNFLAENFLCLPVRSFLILYKKHINFSDDFSAFVSSRAQIYCFISALLF